MHFYGFEFYLHNKAGQSLQWLNSTKSTSNGQSRNLKQQGFKVRKPYAHRGSAVIAPGETMLFTLKILNRPDPTVVFPSYEFRFLEQRRP